MAMPCGHEQSDIIGTAWCGACATAEYGDESFIPAQKVLSQQVGELRKDYETLFEAYGELDEAIRDLLDYFWKHDPPKSKQLVGAVNGLLEKHMPIRDMGLKYACHACEEPLKGDLDGGPRKGVKVKGARYCAEDDCFDMYEGKDG